MNASTLNNHYGPIAGADIDAKLAQSRTEDAARQDATVLERDAGGHVVPLTRRRSFGRTAQGRQALRRARRAQRFRSVDRAR
ncbi:MAG: hypothetical protein GAK41_01144 [Burkholderia gladioli]|nr:MAG: hypothetical protein GAK41_01144 [Burkholderia gladioli]